MTQTIGRFHIRKRLGGGGFGEVFLAEDPTIGRQVAIKVFRPKDENLIAFATSTAEEGLQVLQSRFLNEARILATLEDEPHIINVLEFGSLPDGTPYYVMPYLPRALSEELGKDVFDVNALAELADELKPRPLPLERALDVIEQTLQGLAATHAHGLIHRDIKPGNLMLTERGQIRIVDFGIAKAPDSQHSTVSHLGLGSRNYMAPEQRESAKHVDARADLYSLGVVAYRALTGSLPIGRFADPNVAVPALGTAMNALLLKMLAQDKNDRPKDAGEALAQFQKARASVGQSSEDVSQTWSGEGAAGIRDDLKPLKARIIDLLSEFGRISLAEWPRLQALAAIADLDDTGLNSLISEVHKDDKTLSAKRKLVEVIERQIKLAGGALRPEQLDAFEEAAQTVGWDRARLDVLMRRTLEELAAKTREQAQAKAHATGAAPASGPTAAPKSASQKPKAPFPVKRLATAALVLLIVAGSAWGIYAWRMNQIADNEQRQQQELAAADEQQAWKQAQSADSAEAYAQYLTLWPEGANAAKAKQLQTQRSASAQQAQMSEAQREQARVRQVQDYLNRLGYKVAENGEVDARTTEAIRTFEQAQRLLVTGAVDEVLRQALIDEYTRRDTAAWADATKQDTEAAYSKYRDNYPQGAHIGAVDARMATARETETARQAGQARKAEEARGAAEERKQEEARLAEGKRKQDEARKAEEVRLAEEERVADETQRVATLNAGFKDNGNGTLTDTKTGLVWTQKDNGANINWTNAKVHCEGKGMRLPSIEELAAIYNRAGGGTASCNIASGDYAGSYTCKISPLFRLTSFWFWSSTTEGSSRAWRFYLSTGNRHAGGVGHSNTGRALCVARS